jgi:hypothetical protein
MSETFVFDVDYLTTFEDLEHLREKMLEFVKTERRDYQPIFDVTIQGSMLFAKYNRSHPYLPQIFLSKLK